MAFGQGGKPENGVQRRAHVVGHIGKKRVFGNNGKVGLFQGVLQDFSLFHIAQNLLVDSAVSHDNLGERLPASHVYDSKLQILCFPVPQSPVIDIIGSVFGQLLADIIRGSGSENHVPVVGMNPGTDIIACKPEKSMGRRIFIKTGLRPAAEPVGKDFVRIEIHIQDRFIVYAQSLDNFQTAHVLLIDHFALFVVLINEILELLFPPPFLFPLFGCVRDKHIENIACGIQMDEMPIVLHPADLAVLADDPVFHVIQVVLTCRNLLLDA